MRADQPHVCPRRAAVYGSDDLSQANTVFLDSAFGMGYNLREMAQVGSRVCTWDMFL